jgi:histidinol phosphatase-like enzyme (inositol monophosphatase family)
MRRRKFNFDFDANASRGTGGGWRAVGQHRIEPESPDRGLGARRVSAAGLQPGAVRTEAERLAALGRILRAAGPIALRHFRQPIAVDDKGGARGFDPVTRADREVETFIRDELARAFPDDGVIGEEFGRIEGVSGFTWIIDPIDGTRAFITGQLGWGILLGALREGEPLLGGAYQPYTDELFVGSAREAWLERGSARTRLVAARRADLASAIVYSTDPAMFRSAADWDAFQRLGRQARAVRYGGDCYSLCLLALGQIDVVVEGWLEPFDILPLRPLIEAAGGVVTDRNGERRFDGGLVIAAANPALHAQVLHAFEGSSP